MPPFTDGLSDVIEISPRSPPPREMASTPLVKSAHVTVVRLELPAGKHVPPHRAAGDLVVQCLHGRIKFTSGETTRTLGPHQLLVLAGRELHALIALEDSTLLLTIAS